jgi:gliding motility-associated-like protein
MPKFKFQFYVACFTLLLVGFETYAQNSFVENLGQWKHKANYQVDLKQGRAFFQENQIRFSFIELDHHHPHHNHNQEIKGHNIFYEFINSNVDVVIEAKDPSPHYFNFYYGNNPKHWRTKVYGNNQLKYKNIYDNIDLEVEYKQGLLKYTWQVAPHTEYQNIKITIEGSDFVKVNKEGELVIRTSIGDLKESRPIAWQKNRNGDSSFVYCKYKLYDNHVIGFELPYGYNSSLPLTIDPVLIFASYSGSTSDNWGFTATNDQQGRAYSGGTVYGPGYPTTAGAFNMTFNGGVFVLGQTGDLGRDVGILKYNQNGTALEYATYLGGRHNEQPHSMVVAEDQSLIVFGNTCSNDFPVTATAYDTSYNDTPYAQLSYNPGDVFLTRFSTDGTQILGSTFYGGTGSDGLNGTISFGYPNPVKLAYNYGDVYRGEVITNKQGDIYISTSTQSPDIPISIDAPKKDLGGKQDGIVAKFNKDLSQLLWSTYVGGEKDDALYGINLNSNNDVYVVGGTQSDSILGNQKFDTLFGGGKSDMLLVRISANGDSFRSVARIGTPAYEQAYFVRLDDLENVYIYGQTDSTLFPIISDTIIYRNGNSGQFIAKFPPDLDSLIFSTRFGSGRLKPDISPTAFLVDSCNKIYVSGWGGNVNEIPLGNGGFSAGFPLTQDAFQKSTDSSDFYVAVFAPDMQELLYASYFGGPRAEEHVDGGTSRFDRKGVIYQSVCGGCGGNSDFPTNVGAWSRINRSTNCNNLLFKVDLQIPDIKAEFTAQNLSCAKQPVKFTNLSQRGKIYLWDFDDGTASIDTNPVHVFQNPGIYNVRLITTNLLSCKGKDTFFRPITIYGDGNANFTFAVKPCDKTIDFFSQTDTAAAYKWIFDDVTTVRTKNVNFDFGTFGSHKATLIVDSGTVCEDTKTVNFFIPFRNNSYSFNIDTCEGIVSFRANPELGKSAKIEWTINDTLIFNDSVFDFNAPNKGNYKVKLKITDTFCVDEYNFNFTINYEKPSTNFDVVICNGNIKIAPKDLAIDSFQVFIDDSLISNIPITSIFDYNIVDNQTYKFLIRFWKRGCFVDDDTTITIPLTLNVRILTLLDTCTRRVDFTLLSNYTAGVTHIVDFGDGKKDTFKDVSNFSHRYLELKTYNVSFISYLEPSCTIQNSVSLLIVGNRANFNISPDSCYYIYSFTDTNQKAISTQWFINGEILEGKQVVYSFPKEGVYQITMIDEWAVGCRDTISKTVNVHKGEFPQDVKLYNIFSPNEDGKNEVYYFDFLKNICTPYKMYIYNRWGGLVYENETDEYPKWDGTTGLNNAKVAEGTYYVVIYVPEYDKRLETIVKVIR